MYNANAIISLCRGADSRIIEGEGPGGVVVLRSTRYAFDYGEVVAIVGINLCTGNLEVVFGLCQCCTYSQRSH